MTKGPERVAFGWGVRAPVPANEPGTRPPASTQAAPSEPLSTASHEGLGRLAVGRFRKQPSAGGSGTGVEPRETRDWAYIGLLVFTATLFLRPQDMFPPLGQLHLAEMSAILGLGALVVGRLARRQPVLPFRPEVVGIMLFAALMFALVPFSIWPGGSFEMLTDLYLKVVLIFILMAGTLTTAKRLDRLVWLIVLVSGYLGFRGAFDYARGLNVIENGRVAGAVGGVFQNPNDLAMNMVAFLPPALLLVARRGRPGRRAIAAFAVAMMFATLIFTKSRGGFLGMLAMLAVLLVQGSKIRRGFGVAVIVAIICATPLVPTSFWDRMASITDESKDPTGSREARRTVMKESWRAFVENPITGVGPAQFKTFNPPWREQRWREAHDVWLQVASEDGIFGAIIFFSLIGMAVRDAWSGMRMATRAGRNRAATRRAAGDKRPVPAESDSLSIVTLHATAMSASIVGWMVCATFASIAYTWTFYYVFGIAMAAREIARRHVASSSLPRRAAAA